LRCAEAPSIGLRYLNSVSATPTITVDAHLGNGTELANAAHIINMLSAPQGVILDFFYSRTLSRVSHLFARIGPSGGHHGTRAFHSRAQWRSENCGVRNNYPGRADDTEQYDAQWIGAIPVLTNICVSSEKGKEIHDDKA
jgi:hypothetical protein